ncbi:TPA: Stp1/IreP family PP2C-type Ser/Thr phosphatase [Candidatus Poribacteria bacterium]|nr:Stp1/IreP family PP2C-type Ser/Thr phosphatase [Candidatus Poribacteria bacterium]
MRVGFATDIGMCRKNNEDSLFVDKEKRLYIIADGMGGRQAGEVASKLAVNLIRQELEKRLSNGDENPAEAIRTAIALVNRKIYSKAQTHPELKGMGTTVVVGVIRNGKLALGHVGDSRGYLVRDGKILQLTKDHSLVQTLIDSGKNTKAEAKKHRHRNVLTRVLGLKPTVLVDIKEVPLKRGDKILLATDGLFGLLEEPEILSVVGRYRFSLQKTCEILIRKVLARGAPDNTTAILVHYNRWRNYIPGGWIQRAFSLSHKILAA